MDDWGSHGLPLRRWRDLLTLRCSFLVVNTKPKRTYAPLRTRPFKTGDNDITDDIVVTVFPLLRRPTQENPFVSIGRLLGNDIALADETVSKFHAFVKQEPDGLYLQDARSRNGTAVDGVPVAARGLGPPTKLDEGASIRFGSVVTTFVDADTLRRLATMLDVAV